MRLSTVFELLLIFLLIAFAAYGRVIDKNGTSLHHVARAAKQDFGVSFMSLKQATENVNRYCTCSNNICNCCRNFHIPLVRLQGPGCASLQYLKENNLAVQLSFGDNILTSTVISGKKPRAICVPMPGGLTKFCGRIYSIEREAEDHFKACLGLELQSASELEASLRVSCFRFGPDGLQLRPAESLPPIENLRPEIEDDDDDDDYDIFGLDDDSDESPPAKDPQASQSGDDDEDDDDDDDVLGFGALLDIFTGEDSGNKKKKPSTPAPLLPFTIPLLTKPTSAPTKAPKPAKPAHAQKPLETKKPTRKPEASTTPATLITKVTEPSDAHDVTDAPVKTDTTEVFDDITTLEEAVHEGSVTESLLDADDQGLPVIADSISAEDTTAAAEIPEVDSHPMESPAPSSIVPAVVTPTKPSSVKKIIGIKTVKKPGLGSSSQGSPNAITSAPKPAAKPTKPEPALDNSEEAEEDYILASNSDEEDEEIQNESAEVEDDDEEEEDDSDEDEDTVLSALVSEEEKTKDVATSDNETYKPEEDDEDYGMNLEQLLARKRSSRRQWSGRQSKVMRL